MNSYLSIIIHKDTRAYEFLLALQENIFIKTGQKFDIEKVCEDLFELMWNSDEFLYLSIADLSNLILENSNN